MGVPLEGFGDKVRETAAEGMVLLKNEKQMFPLTKEDHVAIFGRCQINYYKSGTVQAVRYIQPIPPIWWRVCAVIRRFP